MLVKGEMLELEDGKEYTVIYTTEIDTKTYVFLVEHNNALNNQFCEFDGNDQLTRVEDPNIIQQILSNYNKDNPQQL